MLDQLALVALDITLLRVAGFMKKPESGQTFLRSNAFKKGVAMENINNAEHRTKEKLVELIQSAVDGCATYWAGLIADHLIANGVTISNLETVDKEWISVKERLPKQGEDVLVYTITNDVRKAHCYGDRSWFAEDGVWRWVTHWMPLPGMPKGE